MNHSLFSNPPSRGKYSGILPIKVTVTDRHSVFSVTINVSELTMKTSKKNHLGVAFIVEETNDIPGSKEIYTNLFLRFNPLFHKKQ